MSVITDMLKNSEPIVDDLLKIYGSFITGSYAIGGETFGSDIDVVIPIHIDPGDLIARDMFKYGLAKEPSNYNNGVKVFRRGWCVPINIVRLHPFEYCAWLFATNTMAGMPPIIDKVTRHRVFEMFCLAYKLASGNSETLTIDGACAYYDRHKPTATMKTIINISITKEGAPF
ncbi:nucleotidyltransferase domain-containing protein [Fibrobacter sp.]|uniref:nucleotidyltransferase domain-containing protein n=1 Tax=Fibrobacter sp. TaxID=35828 RepID=UPI00388F6376